MCVYGLLDSMPLEMGKRMRAWGIGGRRKHKECYNCTVCRARCVWVLLTVTKQSTPAQARQLRLDCRGAEPGELDRESR